MRRRRAAGESPATPEQERAVVVLEDGGRGPRAWGRARGAGRAAPGPGSWARPRCHQRGIRRRAPGRCWWGALGGRLVGRRRLLAFLGPRLVELGAPAALFVLHQREACAERTAGATTEAGHLRGGARVADQLADDRGAERLAGLRLPDHEAAARILAAPAGVALAVLDDVLAADGAGTEVRPRDADVLEVGVELGDGGLGELRDVAHERLTALLAGLDRGEALLPFAGEPG